MGQTPRYDPLAPCRVWWNQLPTHNFCTVMALQEEYDTVIWAIGREAETKKIGLDKAGVPVDRLGKIHTVLERTNVPHIYAIGDIIVVCLPLLCTTFLVSSIHHCSALLRAYLLGSNRMNPASAAWSSPQWPLRLACCLRAGSTQGPLSPWTTSMCTCGLLPCDHQQ